jgi:hypothetical protein
MSNLVWRSTSDKIHAKTVGEMVVDRTTKTAHNLMWIDAKNWLLGYNLFPKSLTSSYLPIEALNGI